MSRLPDGTVTFLFTDIEGSTRLWEQHPIAMRAALSRHDTLLRAEIEAYHGVVFKTVGDAFCAVFATASDALNAALAAQLALQERQNSDQEREENTADEAGSKTLDQKTIGQAEAQPSSSAHAPTSQEVPDFRVRMALHTGTAQQRDDDYFGPTVNRVARLLAIGHGGQTLLSASTHAFVSEALPVGVSLRDMRIHRLKDLQEPEHVWQLLHPELQTDFPPLKSLGYLPTNLPQQLTSFIGRTEEMREVTGLLGQTRLLTLTGTGGCGKTRMALQIAAELLEVYPQGVWLVELAPLSDPALLSQTLAQTLGIRDDGSRDLTQALIEYLQPKRTLLILDNCEHLVTACAALAEALLKACPQLSILATSREALNVPGELIWQVPPLSLPNRLPTHEKDMAAVLLDFDAIRLFVERAHVHRRDFALTRQSLPAVVTICRQLDGIPLALELAAARIRALSVEQIASRLNDRFHLLTGGSRTALPRQQTLRALIDWSYELLTEQERMLFRRLSVFVNGWTLEAVEAICDFGLRDSDFKSSTVTPPFQTPKLEIQNGEVLDLLMSLIDKSLILYEECEGNARYSLLETIRQYSLHRLMESGEAEEMRRRHRDYFLALALEADPQLSGPEQARWLDTLELEHDNLRAALDRSLEESSGAEAGLRLAAALQEFWMVRGYLSEGRERLTAALNHPEVQVPTATRADALLGAGSLAQMQGDYDAAEALFKASLMLRRALGEQKSVANCLTSLGNVATLRGDYAAARSLYEESLTIHRTLGNRREMAACLNNLGVMAMYQGNHEEARLLYEDALKLYRELENTRGIAILLGNLGSVAFDQGDFPSARAYQEESLALHRELGNRWGMALALLNLGNVEEEGGFHDQARTCYEESLAMRRELGDKEGVALCLSSLGRVLCRQNDYTSAHSFLSEALATCRNLDEKRSMIFTLEAFAELAESRKRPLSAVRLYAVSASLREATNNPLEPHNQVRLDRSLTELRSDVGVEAFAAAWAEGRAMSLEQAIEYASEGQE